MNFRIFGNRLTAEGRIAREMPLFLYLFSRSLPREIMFGMRALELCKKSFAAYGGRIFF
jgi:hypothetical protein